MDVITKRLQELQHPGDLLSVEVLVTPLAIELHNHGFFTDPEKASDRPRALGRALQRAAKQGMRLLREQRETYARMEHLRTVQLVLQEIRHELWEQYKAALNDNAKKALEAAHSKVMQHISLVEGDLGREKAEADRAWAGKLEIFKKGDLAQLAATDEFSAAVKAGFTGSREFWEKQYKPTQGLTAEQAFARSGFRGTMSEWLAQLNRLAESTPSDEEGQDLPLREKSSRQVRDLFCKIADGNEHAGSTSFDNAALELGLMTLIARVVMNQEGERLLRAAQPKTGSQIAQTLKEFGQVHDSVATQDPKYRISPERKLVNADTLEPIPEDEPIFIVRAKDRHAAFALRDYVERVHNYQHIRAVIARVDEFEAFAKQYPERMGEPDTGPKPVA